MNLVVVSSCRPFDIFWMERVHREIPIRAVIQPEWSRPPHAKSRWTKLRHAPWQTLAATVNRRFYQWHGARLNKRAGRLLFGTTEPPSLDIQSISVPAWDLNSFGTADFISRLQPDLMIVSAAPILRPRIFSIPRFGTVNVHLGISPQYRGENTLFWPLYYRDHENLGVTLHFLDESVDTGAKIAQGHPATQPHDSELSLFTKCAHLTADLLTEFLQGRSVAVQGHTSETVSGRQYFRRQRTIAKDLTYWFRRRLLRETLPAQTERRTRFFARNVLVAPVDCAFEASQSPALWMV